MACCDICGAVYTFQKNLLRHIVMTHNEHEQPPSVKSEQCDYEGSYTNLLQHKNNMHREKAIICSLCRENFYTKANFNRHILTKHKDLAPVECPVCYKGFSRKDVMKKHMKDVHFWNLLHRTRFFQCQKW